MTDLTQAFTQWRTRPAEDCYWSLQDMTAAATRERAASVERDYMPRALTIAADASVDGIAVITRSGADPLGFTHHAFAQVSGLAGAPAAYLRSLPAELAADCLSVGLARRDRNERALSMLANTDNAQVRAFTGETYRRLWTADLLDMVQRAIDRSASRYVTPPARLSPGWTGPTRTATPDDCGPHTLIQPGETIRPAGCYYSPHDGRDTFLLLINTDRPVDLPRGATGFRFLMLWNSESGAASVGGTSGIVDYVCGNHILWNVKDVKEFRFRHVGDGLSSRSYRELAASFGLLDRAPWELEALRASERLMLGETTEEVEAAAVRATRLPLSTIRAARESVSGRDYGAPRSAYAVASALTEYSQRLRIEDRIDVDRAAARLYAAQA